MNTWKWLTKKYPLENSRDIMARIGVRFVWCTGPYFLFAIVIATLGDNRLFTSWLTLFMLAIPFVGGLIDSYRLSRPSAERVESGTA